MIRQFILVVFCGIMVIANGQDYLSTYQFQLSEFDAKPDQVITPYIDAVTPNSLKLHPEYGRTPYNAQCEDCIEVLSKRDENSRFFIKRGSNGSHIFSQKSYGPLHFLNEKAEWITRDYRLFPTSSNSQIFTAPNQLLPTFIDFKNGKTGIELANGFVFEFNQGSTLYFTKDTKPGSQKLNNFGEGDLTNYTVGNDGAFVKDVWTGIDKEMIFDFGEIKTNYKINKPISTFMQHGWWVIEEKISLPENYKLIKGKGVEGKGGIWWGSLLLIDSTKQTLATIHKPVVFDSKMRNDLPSNDIAGYIIEKNGQDYTIKLYINSRWLTNPQRTYPIIVDPLVSGSNTYVSGDMAFRFDAVCFNVANYCAYNMTVVTPGKSTIVGAKFDAEYYSFLQGCGIQMINCKKWKAAFAIAGPCGVSPSANGRWTCDTSSPLGTIPGLCYGKDIPMNGTVTCRKPQCPDHVFDFEMRTMHCSCIPAPGINCDTTCHVMRSGTWKITVEARTLEGNVVGSTTICPGDSALLTASGAYGGSLPPYIYLWSTGETTKEITVAPLVNSTYSCTIADSCGVIVIDSATITMRPQPTLNLSATPVYCPLDTTGTVKATAGGTVGPYTYTWNTDPVKTTDSIFNLGAGWYSVRIEDNFGCYNEDSAEVGIILNFNVTPNPVAATCNGISDGSISLVVAGGTAPYTYNWAHGASTQNINNIPAGTYFVTVTESSGCIDTLSAKVLEPSPIAVNAGPQEVIILGGSVMLDPTVSPSGVYNYLWSPSYGLNDPKLRTPTASPGRTTTYQVRASLTTNDACFTTDTMRVVVLSIALPNAFTPNNDGVNDLFVYQTLLEVVEFKIYNRWGNIVHNATYAWDGTYLGVEQPIGTYMYQLSIRAQEEDLPIYFKGNVTLLR